jgi:hypothetical protein
MKTGLPDSTPPRSRSLGQNDSGNQMRKHRVPLLWLIAITLGLLALMMDFISLTGFLLPVVASGVFFIMRLKKVSTVIKPLQLAAPGIPVEAKF